jgi:hypothetical protein
MFSWLAKAILTRKRRVELQQRLNAIPSVTIPEAGLTKRPSIPLAALQDDESFKTFVAAIDWAFSEAITAENAIH